MGTLDSKWDEIKGNRCIVLPETTKIWGKTKDVQDIGNQAKKDDGPWEAGSKQHDHYNYTGVCLRDFQDAVQ